MREQAGALILVALAALLPGALAASCGSSSQGSGGSGAGGAAPATGGGGGSGPKTPKNSCVQPGDQGNDNGVGTYCSPGGKQCEDFPLAALCLADVGQDQWFCTRLGCMSGKDCGADATCLMMDNNAACVPDRCLDSSSTGGGGGAGGSGGTTQSTGGSGGTSATGGGGSGGIITP